MTSEHSYRVRATWTGDRGTGTSGYRDYDRSVTIGVEGKPDLLASADKPFRGDPARWDPEDLLVAALAECHLLSYLHACTLAGVIVVGYEDEATGTMVVEGMAGRFLEVVLHPRVVVAEESMVDAATAAHENAHEWCFIANSVNFPVRYEPTVVVAPAG
jgi:organic hydroperoxide reductase OsmC/OhrA